jgi:hypothetical protein
MDAINRLVAKDEIRDLVLLYCRGIDRQDFDLVQSLYTHDATDTHGPNHYPTVQEFVDGLRAALPHARYTGHHVCNHLISVDGNTGEGEVYALAYHIIPDGQGGWAEYLLGVRYIDQYRREPDGRWRFSNRVVTFDWEETRPLPASDATLPDHSADTSYAVLKGRLFQRGPRG